MQDEKKKFFKTNQTKFKLVVYWSHREDGTPYSVQEIQARYNRKYIASYDYVPAADNKTRTDHELAMVKLLKTMKLYKNNIIKCYLIMNDWQKMQEITIGYFPRGDYDLGNMVYPVFTKPCAKGHRYVDFLPLEPIRIDMMRVENLAKKNKI